MSGYARPVLASQGRLEPGVALVEKPFSEADLLAKAGQVLNSHFPGFKTTRSPADLPQGSEDLPRTSEDPPEQGDDSYGDRGHPAGLR